MDKRGIGNIIFWIGVLITAFVWFLDLGSAQNVIFVVGLVATVVGALMRGGEFGK